MDQYINIFKSLVNRTESEVVEFKRAENSFDFDDLGKYFSALPKLPNNSQATRKLKDLNATKSSK